jgi:hypothetical protein
MTTKLKLLNTEIDQPLPLRPGSLVQLDLELDPKLDPEIDYAITIEPFIAKFGTLNIQGATNEEIKNSGKNPEYLHFIIPESEHPSFRLSFVVWENATVPERKFDVKIFKIANRQRLNKALSSISIPVEMPGTAPAMVVRKDSIATNYTQVIAFQQLVDDSCNRLSFDNYAKYMNFLLCGGDNPEASDRIRNTAFVKGDLVAKRLHLPFNDTNAYRILKMATEAFVLVMSESKPENANELNSKIQQRANSIGAIHGLISNPGTTFKNEHTKGYGGLGVDQDVIIPYLDAIFARLGIQGIKKQHFLGFDERSDTFKDQGEDTTRCLGVLADKLTRPVMIELIWSYWHEQGMLAQTMFAIRNRFQNISHHPATDPLAGLEIGFLRTLNNSIWGYIQDEQHRLTPARRSYEYEHHYGLSLRGSAVPSIMPADRRSKFIEAFHNLLYVCTQYYKQDDDTNRKADAFPVLNALKEVHFLLSEGAHNQFNDLPTTSRIEMLMEQWLLARPEFKNFLPARESVAYNEPWMASVDAMKTLQGWNTTSVMYFNDLARFGESLLLTVRYWLWGSIHDVYEAANWAKCNRNHVQGYVHALRIVTGLDLATEPTDVHAELRRRDPALLIQERWEEQKRMGTARPAVPRITPTPTASITPTLPMPRR